MSFISPVLSFFAIPPTRNFAGISGYVTIQESTTDALEITQQPVQQGASISDHAFKKPINLSIQMQFGSSLFGKSLKEIYQSLLNLQTPIAPNVLTPFTIVTPKRIYPNMLLATLGCTTDKKTENVLAITCAFQEVILVQITTTNVPRSQLKTPAKNAATENAGKKSILLQGAQALGGIGH